MFANEAIAIARTSESRTLLVLGCVAALTAGACNRDGRSSGKPESQPTSVAKDGGIAMCKLMSKEEVNAAIGSAYTIAEQTDGTSSSSCHYSTQDDPAGMSLDLQWILPSEYSNPAEHAALQAAGLGGAKLGGKLTAGMVPGAHADNNPLHIPSGPVQGVGDEATQNLLLLTARKGDYLLMVQIVPDMMALAQDSAAGPKVVEHEHTLARAVFGKV